MRLKRKKSSVNKKNIEDSVNEIRSLKGTTNTYCKILEKKAHN